MGSSSFFKGEKKKQKKEVLERRLEQMPRATIAPRVEIIGKGKGRDK